MCVFCVAIRCALMCQRGMEGRYVREVVVVGTAEE